MTTTGRCACGEVRFKVDGPLRPVINCHCHRCRQWTGHFMAATQAAVDDITIDRGAAAVSWWVPEEEPDVAYGFCSQCGSSLFWRTSSNPDRHSIAAGTLDPPTGLTTDHALFVAGASDYHRLDDKLSHHPYDSPASD